MHVRVEVYQNILNLGADHFFWPYVKIFQKAKRGLELFSLSHFLHDFWRKTSLIYISLTDQISLPNCLYFLWYVHCNYYCLPFYELMNFEINVNFLIKPFSYMTKMWGQKLKYWKKKIAFQMKWKTFFIIFKGFSAASNCLKPKIGHLIQCKNDICFLHLSVIKKSLL